MAYSALACCKAPGRDRQCGSGWGFAFEAGQHLRVARDIIGEKFERDKPVQAGVLGFVNNPMPPPPSFSRIR
ncbi:MAG TPA: hypothetical protein VKB24_05120 [Candidatus Acidoferrum sp.]|nr:hypothetical protein [Candidatus Acidoferrum sp.]